jgi:hypothetical protein
MKALLFVLFLAALFLLAHHYTALERVGQMMDHFTTPKVVPTK